MAKKKSARPAKGAVKAAADRAQARSDQAKGKAAAAAGADGSKVTARDLQRMPGDTTIKSVAAELGKHRKVSEDNAVDMSDFMADMKKSKGIHPAAIKKAESLLNQAKKSDKGLNAVATWKAHFEHYCEVLGLNEMLEKQGAMFTRPETGEKVPANGTNGKGDEERDFRPDNLRHPSAQTAADTVSNFKAPGRDDPKPSIEGSEAKH